MTVACVCLLLVCFLLRAVGPRILHKRQRRRGLMLLPTHQCVSPLQHADPFSLSHVIHIIFGFATADSLPTGTVAGGVVGGFVGVFALAGVAYLVKVYACRPRAKRHKWSDLGSHSEAHETHRLGGHDHDEEKDHDPADVEVTFEDIEMSPGMEGKGGPKHTQPMMLMVDAFVRPEDMHDPSDWTYDDAKHGNGAQAAPAPAGSHPHAY